MFHLSKGAVYLQPRNQSNITAVIIYEGKLFSRQDIGFTIP